MPQRTALTDEDIRAEVTALEQQGHRRLLVLTGEHPKYTFDQFLHVSTHLHSYTRQFAAMAPNGWGWAAECSSIYPGMQPDFCCGC
jgi:2-iminoacetate synthase ThiH